ncbi:uncharacterized protein J4E78_006760 [Alternaria triticimaculans]|uniref:uncharacterized protein n=1 Tax=Alternaria triticimaculans TaxID=297637 RepID=UPI0020C4D785|nr:uncharacterized protein J4E78_006760 [Alternaria triticimaculans]KAI4656869.1 hypothetical protein J4E78_006760 [Alternaria triticimaculans]
MPIDSTPTLSSGFAGEEFINNLGSDLAPLLTLFGEQVTKQFLSMSLGWADHFLLAVGPLGIITTVVSAIRVKSAREKLATAELELLSSTSDATSELWTEEGIVRQPGHATILEMVTYKKTSTKMASSQIEPELEALSETHIGDLSEAYNVGVLSPAQEGRWRRFKALVGKFERMFWSAFSIPSQTKTPKDLVELHEGIVMMNAKIAICEENLDELAQRAEIDMLTERAGSDSGQNAWSADHHDLADAVIAKQRKETDRLIINTAFLTGVAQDLVRRLANQPPNLILNVHNTFPKSGELWAFVMIGMALQFVAVAIPAIMTYHWKEPEDTKPVQDYAYPTFLLGTCLLFVSIALCSYIIEATTVEQVFTPTDGYEVGTIFRLQLQQNMGDQPFNTYLILNHAEDKKILTSRYDPAQQAGKSRAKTQKSIVIIAVETGQSSGRT